MTARRCILPDTDGQNDNRADWANAALVAFRSVTRCDGEDALADLLADLMHWCDRNNASFRDELERARSNYDAETSGEGAAV